MMKAIFYSAVCAGLLCTAGCIREELPVPAHQSGSVKTATVDMGSDYSWQVFYNLRTNSIAARNKITSWDLAFEAAPEGIHMFLNSGKMMYAYRTAKTDFSAIQAADSISFEADKRVDDPTGHTDSTAIGDWVTGKHVYLVKGTDGLLYKFQGLDVNEHRYVIRFARFSGGAGQTVEVYKNDAYNCSYLSFQAGAQVQVEPPKSEWDLVFTAYTHIFRDLDQPYQVTGCLLNPYNTLAVMDSTIAFDQITHETAPAYDFSAARDVIGYNWKAYSFNVSGYIVYHNMNYILRHKEGLYFKLRFVDFTHNGIKGHPKWEYQQL
jgi:hypothetical protein